MAGYSSTPLLKKLGIKESSKLFFINAPADYYSLLETPVDKQLTEKMAAADLFHIFAETAHGLAEHFTDIITVAKSDAVIWISWYKKSAKIPSDVNEDVIRSIILPTGWVDIKVYAVSDIWSGLKIVKRVANR